VIRKSFLDGRREGEGEGKRRGEGEVKRRGVNERGAGGVEKQNQSDGPNWLISGKMAGMARLK